MTLPDDYRLEAPIEIEPSRLSLAAFEGVVENYILRFGTDYGFMEASHSSKVQQVKNQISRGEVKVVYDPNTDSVTLMNSRDFKQQI